MRDTIIHEMIEKNNAVLRITKDDVKELVESQGYKFNQEQLEELYEQVFELDCSAIWEQITILADEISEV